MANRKNAKVKKLDAKDFNLPVDPKEELLHKLEKMREDREKKLTAAREQLVSMLEVTADKYKTATGTAEALRLVRFVWEGFTDDQDIYLANDLAWQMAGIVEDMVEKAKSLEPEKMDQLCDGFYEKRFINDDNSGDFRTCLALEMLKIDLCRNVGGAAEDMVSFVARSQEEIDATEKALAELEQGEGEGK